MTDGRRAREVRTEGQVWGIVNREREEKEKESEWGHKDGRMGGIF